jgi:hypothetical protein
MSSSSSKRGHPASIMVTLLALSGLGACANFKQTPRYEGDVVATEAGNVTRCKFIGSLQSSSGLTGLFAPKGVDNIKQDLLQQADTLDATHVVWDASAANLENTSLSGKAYRCPDEGGVKK